MPPILVVKFAAEMVFAGRAAERHADAFEGLGVAKGGGVVDTTCRALGTDIPINDRIIYRQLGNLRLRLLQDGFRDISDHSLLEFTHLNRLLS